MKKSKYSGVFFHLFFTFSIFDRNCPFWSNMFQYSVLRICLIFLFSLSLLSRTFTNHRTAGEGGGYFYNSLPLSPNSQTLRHHLSNFCKDLTSTHSWWWHSNREPYFSERKLLTTKLRAITYSN